MVGVVGSSPIAPTNTSSLRQSVTFLAQTLVLRSVARTQSTDPIHALGFTQRGLALHFSWAALPGENLYAMHGSHS